MSQQSIVSFNKVRLFQSRIPEAKDDQFENKKVLNIYLFQIAKSVENEI